MAGLADLEALQNRKEAILSGLRDLEAEYPELTSSVGDFERDARVPGENDHDGIMTTSDALPEFRKAGSYSYEYDDPKMPGAAPGRNAGPMADELEGIPGVVSKGSDGVKRVDPARLSLANAGVAGETVRRQDSQEGKIAELTRRLEALRAATAGGDEGALSAARSGRF